MISCIFAVRKLYDIVGHQLLNIVLFYYKKANNPVNLKFAGFFIENLINKKMDVIKIENGIIECKNFGLVLVSEIISISRMFYDVNKWKFDIYLRGGGIMVGAIHEPDSSDENKNNIDVKRFENIHEFFIKELKLFHQKKLEITK